jgi:hypothetical protein
MIGLKTRSRRRFQVRLMGWRTWSMVEVQQSGWLVEVDTAGVSSWSRWGRPFVGHGWSRWVVRSSRDHWRSLDFCLSVRANPTHLNGPSWSEQTSSLISIFFNRLIDPSSSTEHSASGPWPPADLGRLTEDNQNPGQWEHGRTPFLVSIGLNRNERVIKTFVQEYLSWWKLDPVLDPNPEIDLSLLPQSS